MQRSQDNSKLEHDLRRITPELEMRYGVRRMGYFFDFCDKNAVTPAEVNIIVELRKPMGWKFFEMKEYIERKLYRRIDVVTPNGIKVLFKPDVMRCIQWL